MRRTILVSAAVLAFVWSACTQAAIVYEVIDLGTLGGDESLACSINDAGRIVGQAKNNQGHQRATLFDPTGAGNNIDLGTLGGDESLARSINNAGQIVGWTENGQGIRFQRATLFDHTGEGNNTDLGTLGGQGSAAFSINDAGRIVGFGGVFPDWLWHATLFDTTGAGNNVDLGTLVGGSSFAHSINNSGQIVGGDVIPEDMYDSLHAILFDPTGACDNINLGTQPLQGDYSRARSINDAGQIAGYAVYYVGARVVCRATLFDPTGAGDNIDLGTLGGNFSQALSINDTGQIVGWSYNSEGSEGDERATLFDPTGAGNNIDLNTSIDPASGWTLEYAYDINNSGWIVGQGINPQGEYHAFLLVPCMYKLTGDLNDDCKVDFADFALMAVNWLMDCRVDPMDPACVPK